MPTYVDDDHDDVRIVPVLMIYCTYKGLGLVLVSVVRRYSHVMFGYSHLMMRFLVTSLIEVLFSATVLLMYFTKVAREAEEGFA